MPFAEWPAMDREAWAAAVTSGDILDESGPAAHWSPRTRQKRIESYGRWLTYLAHRGILDQSNRPGDRVRRDTVASFIDELSRTRAPYTVLCRIEDLYGIMAVIAADHDWSWLRRAASRLRARTVGARNKEYRIRPSKELFALGIRLMGEAESEASITVLERAFRYRDGLMIALLAARPVRRGNFANIVVGKNLIATPDGYWLHFDASETKNARPIDVPVPTGLAQFLARYLDQHRPNLLRGSTCAFLWISKRGAAMAGISIYGRIMDMTRHAFGEAVNPHLFRDCAATSIAIDDPEHVRIAVTLLGHASLRTTQRHYDQSRMIASGRRYQREMLALRRRLCARGRRGDPKNTGQGPQIE